MGVAGELESCAVVCEVGGRPLGRRRQSAASAVVAFSSSLMSAVFIRTKHS